MSKHYIIINLNKAESAETRLERIREQVRWGVFGRFLGHPGGLLEQAVQIPTNRVYSVW